MSFYGKGTYEIALSFRKPRCPTTSRILEKTRPEEVDKSTLSLVQKIHDQFKECQMLAP